MPARQKAIEPGHRTDRSLDRHITAAAMIRQPAYLSTCIWQPYRPRFCEHASPHRELRNSVKNHYRAELNFARQTTLTKLVLSPEKDKQSLALRTASSTRNATSLQATRHKSSCREVVYSRTHSTLNWRLASAVTHGQVKSTKKEINALLIRFLPPIDKPTAPKPWTRDSHKP